MILDAYLPTSQEESIERLKAFGREKHLKRARSKEKALAKVDVLDKPEAYRKKAKIQFNPAVSSGNDVLHVNELSMAYDDRVLFKGVNFDIYRGEKVALIGPNGAGKSTLFKILMNELTPVCGDFKLGTNVNISYFHQEQKTLNLDNTIIDEIWDTNDKLTQTEIRNMLGSLLFEDDDVFKKISTLSGGERARIAILKLILSKANFLLLDEPTNHLDIDSKEVLEEALENYTGTIFTISHDRYFLDQVSTKTVVLDDGKITEYLGNYSYYKEKLKEQEDLLALANEQNLEADKVESKSGSADEPALSASESTEENQKKPNAYMVEKQLAEVESEIARLEATMKMYEVQLANPVVQQYLEEMSKISMQIEETQSELDSLYEKWERLSE